jgi:hypothetical protein
MRRSRGVALMWLLLLFGLGALTVVAALGWSRANVRARVTTVERADALFYADAVAERAVAFLRANTNISGALTSSTTQLTGTLPTTGVPMAYVIDFSSYNSTGALQRSFVVRITPQTPYGGAGRTFVARARLRPDLSVGEWLVLDHAPVAPSTVAPTLPTFASCGATIPRVTSGSGLVSNSITWSWATAARPDRMIVEWHDGLVLRSVTVPASSLTAASGSVAVTTPYPASGEPQSFEYRLRPFFEAFDGVEREVDACLVTVESGRFYFSVQPLSVCALNDTVIVHWRVNADSGVSVVRRSGTTTTTMSTATSGSMPVAVNASSITIELRMPGSIGTTQALTITVGGC